MPTSTMGLAARLSTTQNAPNSATEPTSRETIAGEVHPHVLPCRSARVSAPVMATHSAVPGQSTFLAAAPAVAAPRSAPASGTQREPSQTARPTGTLTQKIARQPASSTRPPPMSGPRAIAAPETAP